MINDFGDFLGVSLENGHNLFRVLVEDNRIFVISSGKNFTVIRWIDVDGQNTRNTSRVQRLERGWN